MKRVLVTGAGGFVGARILDMWRGQFALCAFPSDMHLGKNPLQQPGEFQQLEAHRRDGRKDDLVEFGGNALPGYDPDPRRIAADGIEGLLLDREAQLRGETHGTHHAQGVVREGDVGVARRTDDALLQVLHPVERVYQLAERIGIERPCHRIDRKVTAALVVFQRPGLDRKSVV